MRPIVSFCGSTTYQLSKYLTTILQLLTDKSRRKLQSAENFIDAIKTVQIPDDYKLVTSVLMWNHCSPVFHFNWHYSVPRPLYNNLHLNYRYRQKTSWTYWTFALHRLTFSTTVNTTSSCMEQLSPVSVVVAEILMQHVEESALATCRQTIPLWLRYVDDTFTAVHKDEVREF